MELLKHALSISEHIHHLFTYFLAAMSTIYLLYAEGEDYFGGMNVPFVFFAESTISCMNITIIDDQISESLEEIFDIRIDSIDTSNIQTEIGDFSSGTVTIIDDDGIYSSRFQLFYLLLKS